MNSSFDEIIRRHARPLDPIQTDEKPVLRQLLGVRAVMFDVYGTLLISAGGDNEASDSTANGQAFIKALSAVGIQFQGDGDTGMQLLVDEIQAANLLAQQNGIEYPEVDIVAIWRQIVSRILDEGLAKRVGCSEFSASPAVSTISNLKRLALEYEMRVNPVWPMPHARECLGKLYGRGLRLGVISNAQFLTIEILRTLVQANSNRFELDKELQYYSYEHGRAKPGLALYEFATEALARSGIRPSEVLYIGNDMLKDVMPASSIGFRTALFAGDARSLRRREDDSRVAGVSPELVITDLSDLPKCLV